MKPRNEPGEEAFIRSKLVEFEVVDSQTLTNYPTPPPVPPCLSHMLMEQKPVKKRLSDILLHDHFQTRLNFIFVEKVSAEKLLREIIVGEGAQTGLLESWVGVVVVGQAKNEIFLIEKPTCLLHFDYLVKRL